MDFENGTFLRRKLTRKDIVYDTKTKSEEKKLRSAMEVLLNYYDIISSSKIKVSQDKGMVQIRPVYISPAIGNEILAVYAKEQKRNPAKFISAGGGEASLSLEKRLYDIRFRP